jgi:hypothetical protein
LCPQILGKSAIPTNSKEYDAAITAFTIVLSHYDFTVMKLFCIFGKNYKGMDLPLFYGKKFQKAYPSMSQSTDNSKEYRYRNFENKDEIIVFKQSFWEFGITLRDLYFLGPREIDQIIFH